METLTKEQINRQDFVDGEIFELIKKLLPEIHSLIKFTNEKLTM